MGTDIEIVHAKPDARANWGRWVSECGGLHCRNAWQVEPGETSWACYLCGSVNDVRWPNDPAAIEYLLSLRPDVITRNWVPGETIQDLIAENALHGIGVPGVEPAPGEEVVIVDIEMDMVVGGLLLEPVRARRRELEAQTGRTFDHFPLEG